MEFLSDALNVLNWLATNIPVEAIIASGILSAVLVPPQKVIKKLFVHHEIVMISLVGLGGMAIAGINYVLNTPSIDPNIVALQGLALSFMSQPIYYLVVKPFSIFASAKFAKTIAEAKELNQAKQALVPEGLSPTPTKIEDFSL